MSLYSFFACSVSICFVCVLDIDLCEDRKLGRLIRITVDKTCIIDT